MSFTNHRRAIARRTTIATLLLIACSATPVLAQVITAPGLSAPGSISYDAEHVATIQATTDNDVAFLQGYSHARDRFFEMDYTRRGVSGTLAELVGPAALANDIQVRTLGLRRAAVRSFNALSADTRSWLQAYANGVNFWLATNPLPPEYGALDVTHAKAWEPVDSIAVGKGLAFQLSFDLDTDATIAFGAYQQAAAAAGINAQALYFVDTHRAAPADSRVTVPGFMPTATHSASAQSANAPSSNGSATNIAPISQTTLDLARSYRDAVRNNPLLAKAVDGRDTPIGSNEWVIGGSHTASGKPILSNDPHLGLSLAPVFMEQHLYSTDSRSPTPMDVTGVTVPGAPGVIQGCNQRVCWGTTTNSLDVTDVFQEQLRLNTNGLPYAIVHDGQEEPVQWIFQNYYVNQLDGTPDNIKRDNSIGYTNGAISLVVPRRNNGPIVQLLGSTGLSVAYTGFGATKELESFRRINRASNLAEFEDALTYFDFGSQNFAYADIDGNIAYFTSAEEPIRTDLQTGNGPGGGVPPFFIRDGSGALKHDWLPVMHPQPNQATPYEILPASEMPYVINPEQGYFANANNDPIGFSLGNNVFSLQRPGGGIYYLDSGGSSSLRMGRIDREIQRLIGTGNSITSADMMHLQANNQLLDAELLLPHLLAAFDEASASGAWSQSAALAANSGVSEAIGRLRNWDYSSPTGITAGYDEGDDPNNLPAPSQAEIDASVAATIWATWRGQAIHSTIDAALGRVGLGNYLPGSSDGFNALKFHLDSFPVLHGVGASGLNFFAVAGAPDASSARDFVLLKALSDSLDLLASDGFASAFGGSHDQSDYRWGKLHRITFKHPLGGPFSIPGPNPYPFQSVSADLPGVAKQGGYESVDAASHNTRANTLNGFTFGSGPARRFVGEMLPTISAAQIIPGGPSGVIGSPFYASQLGRWLTDHYKALPIPVADATANVVEQLDFQP
ncbi:MAG: penicillin acylase family protein [Dokdonella sp.]